MSFEASSPLQQLALRHGLLLGFTDVFGTHVPASDEALGLVLGALGVACESPQSIETSLWQAHTQEWLTRLAPVRVLRQNSPWQLSLKTPQAWVDSPWQWQLTTEAGQVIEGQVIPCHLSYLNTTEWGQGESFTKIVDYAWNVPVPEGGLEPGYHTLKLISPDGRETHTSRLIVTPAQCYWPASLKLESDRPEHKAWGPALQLYSLRGKKNWGMGNWSDLKTLSHWCGQVGADVIGLNPMHALYPHNSQHISPYSPSSRQFFNTAYLDVTALEDFAECPQAKTLVNSADFKAAIEKAQGANLVDYATLMPLKMEVLDWLYLSFYKQHLEPEAAQPGTSPRARAFNQFVYEGGESLLNCATYQAMQEAFFKADQSQWGWPVWPKIYQSPQSPAVKEFQVQNTDRIRFYQYLQWCANLQLAEAQAATQADGLRIGLYMDLAVGADMGGVDVWCNPELYSFKASIGCPPDAFNQLGQNWGLPSINPQVLRQQAYQPFIEMVRANMRHSGALRLDHAVALFRAFWVPQGESGQKGAFVQYPAHDLLGILALESHRNQCLVIGEDLGTVPEYVTQTMADWGVLSYKVFYFEKNGPDSFKRPEEYPKLALTTLSTHDLPTAKGFWDGVDIEVRSVLNLFPSPQALATEQENRQTDKAAMLRALLAQNLLPAALGQVSLEQIAMRPALCQALYAYQAMTPSKIQMIQLEDALEQEQQMNLPGTTEEHPNWRRRLSVAVEDLPQDARIIGLASIVGNLRGAKVPLKLGR